MPFEPPPRNEVQELLAELAMRDRHGAVWCAVLCIRTVATPLAPAVQTGLRLLALWAQGARVSPERMKRCWWDCNEASINHDAEPRPLDPRMEALVGDRPVTVIGGTPPTDLANAVAGLLYCSEERYRSGVTN